MGAVVEGRDPSTGQVLTVRCSGGRVLSVRRSTSADGDLPFLAPGLVDLQVNGFDGHDVNGGSVDADTLLAITASLRRRGVTTWVPTVVTAPEDAIRHVLVTVARARATHPEVAAAVPFVHVEGPFISALDGPRGVHDQRQIRPIDPAEVERWQAAGPVGYVTLSPHGDGAADAVAAIVRSGCAVAIGHTEATPQQVRAAADAGATLSTHLGNGTFLELRRHPNHLWSQLAEDRLDCGFIADGHHLDGDTLRVMLRATGGRAYLVSDAVALAGAPPGRYRTPVGGEVTLSEDGRLSHAGSGLLAGAAASLADGLRFVVSGLGLSLAEGLALATTNPGRVATRLGAAPVGGIVPGRPADLVLLDSAGAVLQVGP